MVVDAFERMYVGKDIQWYVNACKFAMKPRKCVKWTIKK